MSDQAPTDPSSAIPERGPGTHRNQQRASEARTETVAGANALEILRRESGAPAAVAADRRCPLPLPAATDETRRA